MNKQYTPSEVRQHAENAGIHPTTDYQIAKRRFFNQIAKPESLTRRGNTLIACYLTPRWDRKVLQWMIFDEIRKLFPGAAIHKVVVDRHYVTRAYFSLGSEEHKRKLRDSQMYRIRARHRSGK